LTLELINPINIGNYRTVRKFLELSENNTSIVSDSVSIYGLGEIRGKYNPTTESLFVIKFLDHYKWELLHDNNSLMIVEYGIPALPKDKIDRKKFYADFPRILKGITKGSF
jgi:hypothetical protein